MAESMFHDVLRRKARPFPAAVGLAIAGLLLVCSPARAHVRPDIHGFTGAAAKEKLDRFNEADTNGDKLLTVEEFTVVLEKLQEKSKPASR